MRHEKGRPCDVIRALVRQALASDLVIVAVPGRAISSARYPLSEAPAAFADAAGAESTKVVIEA